MTLNYKLKKINNYRTMIQAQVIHRIILPPCISSHFVCQMVIYTV